MSKGIANNSATICYYTTGQGIRKDCEIVKKQLLDAGWQVTIVELDQKVFPDWFYTLRSEIWDRIVPDSLKLITLMLAQFIGRSLQPSKTDLVVFLERLHFPTLLRAKHAVLIPNQEWYPKRETYALRTLSGVLCKTRHAEALFRQYNSQVHFVSFTSDDHYLPLTLKDYSKYVHIAGKSRQKGTKALVEAWIKHPDWPQLIVVYRHDLQVKSLPSNITLIQSVLTEKEIQQLQNAHGVHICLSEVEGFGHYIVEAMSCQALVITTDAPPMNEIITSQRGVLTPVESFKRQSLGYAYNLAKDRLEENLERIIRMTPCEKARYGNEARTWYLNNHALFRSRFAAAVNSIISAKDGSLGVAHEQ